MSTQNDIVVISSNLRTGGAPNAAQFNLLQAGSLRGTYELLSFQSVDNLTTVTVGENDKIYFDEGGPVLVATVAPGSYANQTDANAAIKTALDAVSGSTFTPSINSDGTVTWAIAAGTFRWRFGPPQNANNDSANQLLGVPQKDTLAPAASITGQYVPTLRGATEGLLIKLFEDNLQQVRLLNGGEFSFFIPVETSFGQNLDYIKRAAFSQSVKFSNTINILNISLFDIDGELLQSTTPEYVLTLRRLF
jgi:hypothetical protein